MIPLSLKVIGRRKVRFHLDDLVYFGRRYKTKRTEGEGPYFWICRMAEPVNDPTLLAIGTACGVCGEGFMTQHEAEEAALEHLAIVHRGTDGQRLPPHRGQQRRERQRERWNDRRRAENEKETQK